jgi:hypothetical protein
MLNDIYKEVAEELGLPKQVVKKAYSSFWKFIRTTIGELPLKEDLSEEEFDKLKTNFNIPSLGKLNCTIDKFNSTKKKLDYIKKYREKYDKYKED